MMQLAVFYLMLMGFGAGFWLAKALDDGDSVSWIGVFLYTLYAVLWVLFICQVT